MTFYFHTSQLPALVIASLTLASTSSMADFNFVVVGGGIASGHATKIFRKKGGSPGDVAIIPIDEVLDSNFGEPLLRFREPQDVDSLLQVIKGKKVGKTVIVRGGYFGVELGIHLKNNNCGVTLVFPESSCVPSLFTTEMADVLELYCHLKGIDIIKGVGIVGFECKKNEIIEGVKLEDDRTLKADIVFMGLCARPITNFKTEEEINGGLKMESFLKTSVSNLFLLGDVVSDKLQDFINIAGGNEGGNKEAQLPKSPDDTKIVRTIISLDKQQFLRHVEPKTRNLALLTGVDKKLNPDCYVNYIRDLCASMSREQEYGPMSIIVAPEDDVYTIVRLFGTTSCSATLLSLSYDFYFCDVIVSTLPTLERNLYDGDPTACKSVCFVVIFDVDGTAANSRCFLRLLKNLREGQIIVISPVYTNLLEEVVKSSNRDWDFELPSFWIAEKDAEKEDSVKE